ncbi:Wzt carbohydrate-binding domain-containing protein [Paraburkholderia sediminicola]|uniref:Wzt carbohydrate-binding domain-containing protein n=1 Tax=Paraburkholderia sediminicola TaxID=458836 RepID=UPI0038BC142A
MRQAQSVLFSHIPKTGGTSLHKLFEQAAEGDCTEQIKSMQYSKALAAYSRYSIISGHFWFAPGEKMSRARTNVTMLRNPLDRALSHYFFSKNDVGTSVGGSLIEGRLDLMEYISSVEPSMLTAVSNFQTKLLAPLGGSNPGEGVDCDLLVAAKKALDEFDLVGVYEDFDDSVNLILHECGFSPVDAVPKERVTSSRAKFSDLPYEAKRRLEELNYLDLELYSYAQKRFNERRRRTIVSLIRSSVYDQHRRSNRELESELTAISTSVGSFDHIPLNFGNKEVEIIGGQVVGDISLASGDLLCGENFRIELQFHSKIDVSNLTVGISLHDKDGGLIFGTNTLLLGRTIKVASGCCFQVAFCGKNYLGVGCYSIGISVHTGNSHLERCFEWRDQYLQFQTIGILGHHFEGRTNLALTSEVACPEEQAPLIEVVNQSGWRSLTIHNPPVARAGGRLEILGKPHRLKRNEIGLVEVEFRNECDVRLGTFGLHCFCFSYRWYAADDNRTPLMIEGTRSSFDRDIEPGDVARLWVNVGAPPEYIGPAVLRIVPLQEGVAWFDDAAGIYADMEVEVY